MTKNYKHKYLKYKKKYLELKKQKNSIMSSYRVHVSLPWYNLIKSGRKTVEGRPNKGDFAKMQINDHIIFFNRELDEEFEAIITKISHHNTFREMILENKIENVLPIIDNIDDGVAVYMQYYTPEIEKQYGVVGIHVRKI